MLAGCWKLLANQVNGNSAISRHQLLIFANDCHRAVHPSPCSCDNHRQTCHVLPKMACPGSGHAATHTKTDHAAIINLQRIIATVGLNFLHSRGAFCMPVHDIACLHKQSHGTQCTKTSLDANAGVQLNIPHATPNRKNEQILIETKAWDDNASAPSCAASPEGPMFEEITHNDFECRHGSTSCKQQNA